jgi:hypothetical protein
MRTTKKNEKEPTGVSLPEDFRKFKRVRKALVPYDGLEGEALDATWKEDGRKLKHGEFK